MMKRTSAIALLCSAILFTVALHGGDTEKLGKALTLKEATPIAELRAHPDQFAGKRVLVEGIIQDVCQKKGCWITVSDGSSSEPLQVKVDDDVIVFPKSGKGWSVRAEGVLSVKTMTREELVKQARHEAEEQGKLEGFDASGIEGPKTIVRIEGEGAEIQKK